MCILVYSLPWKAVGSPLLKPSLKEEIGFPPCHVWPFCIKLSILVGQRAVGGVRRVCVCVGGAWVGVGGSSHGWRLCKGRNTSWLVVVASSHSAGATAFTARRYVTSLNINVKTRTPARAPSSSRWSLPAFPRPLASLQLFSFVRLASLLHSGPVANSFISKCKLMAYTDCLLPLHSLWKRWMGGGGRWIV